MHQTQWVEASREAMESGGFPGNFPGKRQTQWVKRVTGDKSAFRAQEAFGRVLFEKHIFSGFPKMHPLRQKGHLSPEEPRHPKHHPMGNRAAGIQYPLGLVGYLARDVDIVYPLG